MLDINERNITWYDMKGEVSDIARGASVPEARVAGTTSRLLDEARSSKFRLDNKRINVKGSRPFGEVVGWSTEKLAKYSEDQERDEHGRFGSGDGEVIKLPNSLHIPRAEMPQISKDNVPDYLNWLGERGVGNHLETVSADSLKPIQSVISARIAALMPSDAAQLQRPVITSKDSYILDGHHRWYRALNENKPVNVIRVDAPMKSLLGMTREYPKAQYRTIAESVARVRAMSPKMVKLDGAIIECLDIGDLEDIERAGLEKEFNPDQPRDDHGRFATSGGASGEKPFHARLKERMVEAATAKTEIDTQAVGIDFGSETIAVPLKSWNRASEKVEREYGGNPERITDLARNTILAQPGTEHQVLGSLLEKYPSAVVKIHTADDNPLGYAGILVKVPTNSDGGAEVQIVSPMTVYAKEAPAVAKQMLGESVWHSFNVRSDLPPPGLGHKYYETWRTASPTSPEFQRIPSECREYYGAFHAAERRQ
jgi:hypothetical protein